MNNDAATGSTGNLVMTRDQLVARVKRAGELEVSGEDQAETDSYFDMAHSASTVRTVSRGLRLVSPFISRPFARHSTIVPFGEDLIVAEGNYIACQTWIEGTFARVG